MRIATGHILEFQIGDIVYLKTDEEQKDRIITSIRLCADNGVLYSLSCGMSETIHYSIEISPEKNVLSSLM